MNTPPLSILIPFRNAAKTLPACLESTLQQSFGEYELLAVDDGSTDESVAAVRGYAVNDPRIRLLEFQGQGIVAALNTGLAQAAGEIIVRMDADDLMLPHRLQAQVRHFQTDDALTLSAAQVRMFPEQKLRGGFREYLRWQNSVLSAEDIANEIYVEAPFAHPSVAYRRSAVLKLGGYREGDFPEDYDLWLRMFHQGFRMAKIPKILADWRDGEARLSRSDPRYSRQAFDRLRAAFLARDPRLLQLEDRPLAFWGAGRRTRRRVDHLIAHGFRPAFWIDIDPHKIGNEIDGAPVCPPDTLNSEGRRPFVLVYVSNHGARDLIRARLADYDYSPGRDFLMVG